MMYNACNGSVAVGSTDMDYVSFGGGEKKLILLPGLSDGLATVKGKALILAKPYRIFFDDYTVYMFSRKNSLPAVYSIQEMADDQAEAMRRLGIEKAAVLGVSEGGMIAQCLAARFPGMVEKLVVAVSAPKVNEKIRSAVSRWIELAENGEHKQLLIDTAELSYSEEYLKQFRKLYPVIASVGRHTGYGRFLSNANAILRFDASEETGRITCPTLIIAGEEDKIVGVQASYELKERIAGSELYVYPGLGHAAYEEAKDFNSRICDFLRK